MSPSGGATKSIVTLIKGVVAAGHKAYVVSPRDSVLRQQLEAIGVTVDIIGFRPDTYPVIYAWWSYLLFLPLLPVWLIRNVLALHKLKALCRNRKIDIVHTNVSVIGIGYTLSRYLCVPHVYHIREYGDSDFGYHYFPTKSAFRRRLWAPDSYNICITRDIQVYHGQTDNPSSQIIYNGISIGNVPAQLSLPPDYFLYAGRVEEGKGVMDMLRAYTLYANQTSKPTPLLLAGSVPVPDFGHAVESFLDRNNLGDNVRLLGQRDDVNALMQGALALIVPSPSEGFGRTMPEAMLSDCLVVARDAAGLAEQMQNGRTACGSEIALSFKTEHELADLLVDVASQPREFFNDMRVRAKSVVKELYSPETYVSRVLQLYNIMISKHNSQ